MDSSTAEGNLVRFSGLADHYDKYRPTPPAAVVELLTQYCGRRPRLIVDLGSGTGLSCRIWAGRCDHVIGIEPNDDMRRRAAAAGGDVAYRNGRSTATDLADGCADIVTCSQALHWMDPQPTFAEVRRILRPSGVFAAYDCDWPPLVHPDIDAAYERFEMLVRSHEKPRLAGMRVTKWAKEQHLERMRESGQFAYVREVVLQQVESGDADRVAGVALSQGSCAALLRDGFTEEQLGLSELRAVAQRVLGVRQVPWYWSYRVQLGVV